MQCIKVARVVYAVLVWCVQYLCVVFTNSSALYSIMKRGVFIVFEGADGTGKSTQVKRLVERLCSQGAFLPILLAHMSVSTFNGLIPDTTFSAKG